MTGVIIDFDDERSWHGELLGRDTVIEKLRWLLDMPAQRGGRWVLLSGSAGVGKSAIVHRLLELLPPETPYHFIRRDTGDTDRPEAVVQNLCARIERIFPEQTNTELPMHGRLGDLLKRVSKRHLVPQGRRLTVVIDGLDEAAHDSAGHNLLPRFLPRALPAGVVLLCASRMPYRQFDGNGPPPDAQELNLDDEAWAESNEAACRAFCEQRLGRLTPPLDPAVIEEVVRRAQGKMLIATFICTWLEGQPPA